MPKIIDVISLIPDIELQGWIHKFFLKQYGSFSLQLDVENWFYMLDGTVDVENSNDYKGNIWVYNHLKPAGTLNSSTLLRANHKIPVYRDRMTLITNAYKPIVCLYGLIYRLSQNT